MASVDDRIVNMKFNNGQFESGISKSLSSLEALKRGLKLENATKGLSDVSAAARGVSLNHISAGIDTLNSKFRALSVIGVTALATIASRAVSAGLTLLRSFTVAPIIQGLHEYETQLQSIQTILANTGLKGQAGLNQVNAALNNLNAYSDKTIYNFTEMARNIGTFTAAGVKLQPATEAIKGIANLAALSGSTADQASTAMYQLSQAIANNKVGLMDWNSVVNAGMGGKVFQKALFNTAKQLGTIKNVPMGQSFEKWTAAGNSFRNSLQKGWLTGKVLTQTLSQFTGDLTDAQLKAMGYNAAQIKQIQEQAKVAQDAATKVKTLHQLMDTLKEAIGSGWAQTFSLIIGNFHEAQDLWTGVSNAVGGFIQTSAKARNKVLGDWKALGGRTALIGGIAAAFHALAAVVKPIKDAFRDIFPKKTGQDLYDLTNRFRNFMERLKIGADTAENLKRTFRGVFAIFDIGKQVVSGIFHMFGKLFGVLSGGASSFLNFTGNLGDFLVSIDQALKKGDKLSSFFSKLGDILAIPLAVLVAVGKAIFGLFDGFDKGTADAMSSSLSAIGDRFSGLLGFGGKIADVFRNVLTTLKPLIDSIVAAFASIGDAITNAFSTGNFQGVLDVINTTLLGGIFLLIRKFLKTGFGGVFGGGVLSSISGTFQTLTGSLKAMQTQINAKTLLIIAGAIALLTASVVALSMIDSAKLSVALHAMAAGFAELLASMAILTKISASAGFVKVPIIAGSMILLATAVLILTAAVKNLSSLSWEELAKGLGGVAVLLLAISLASGPLSANSSGMIRAGVGIAAIAIAMNLLYLAVKGFASLSWAEIGKGLAAVAASLLLIGVAMRLMPTGMTLQAAALIGIGIALNILYLAVKNFADLKWKEMGKGLLGIAGALVVIGLAMQVMPKDMLLQAAALIIVASALLIVGKAIGLMGSMSFKTIGKGLGTIALALGILAAGLYVMEGAIGGAAALMITAVALRVLIPVIQSLGAMPWQNIVRGLITLAATFAILGVGALLLAPVSPVLLAIGVACLLIGVGIGAAAAGLGLLATGLAALAGVGTAGITVMLAAIEGLILKIPDIATALALGIVNVVKIIGQNAPTIIAAFGKIIDELLKLIIKEAPVVGTAFAALLDALLKVISDETPKIIAAGYKLLLDFLKGIRDNIGQIVTVVAEIIVKFINALANNLTKIIAAGTNLLIKLLKGISDNLGKVITAATSIVTKLVTGIGNNAGRVVTAGANAIIKFVTGIGNNATRVVTAGANAVIKFLSGVASNGVRVTNAALDIIVKFVNGLASAIRSHEGDMRSAGWNLASAIISGMTLGLSDLAGGLVSKAAGIAGDVLGAIGGVFRSRSPSKETIKIGISVMQGLMVGLDKENDNLQSSVKQIGTDSLSTMKSTFNKISDVIADNINVEPVITPVLDLTNVQKDASKIGGLLNVVPITAAASYRTAAGISTSQQKAIQDAELAQAAIGPTVKFEQTNNSPVALSTQDIYRLTKNQLAQAKTALGL